MLSIESIEYGKRVTLRYKMQVILSDGKRLDKEHERVIDFIYGVEEQPKSLEKAIYGAKKGDRLKVHIPARELYGERDENLVREIPKKGLIKQRVRKGQYYRQIKNGTLISFKVLDIKSDSVVADFNPPMAGVSTDLDIEILDVRKASSSEIELAKKVEAKRKIGCE
jgi:FKBP-type peptidyl-prolyl cis-trans isomerase SlyD